MTNALAMCFLLTNVLCVSFARAGRDGSAWGERLTQRRDLAVWPDQAAVDKLMARPEEL